MATATEVDPSKLQILLWRDTQSMIEAMVSEPHRIPELMELVTLGRSEVVYRLSALQEMGVVNMGAVVTKRPEGDEPGRLDPAYRVNRDTLAQRVEELRAHAVFYDNLLSPTPSS